MINYILNPVFLEAFFLLPLSIYTGYIGIQTIRQINYLLKNKGRADLELLTERKNLVKMAIGSMCLLAFALFLTSIQSYNAYIWALTDISFVLVILKSFKIMNNYN